MATFCVDKRFVDKLKDAFKTGKLDIKKLNADSSTRRKTLSDIVGEEYAEQISTHFERKLLLKNQEKATYEFISDVLGKSEAKKAELLEKVRKNAEERKRRVFDPKADEAFLNEIASDAYERKFGTEVTLQEAQAITEMTAQKDALKSKMGADFTFPSKKEALEYGASERALKNYVDRMKKETPQEGLVNPLTAGSFSKGADAVLTDVGISANFIARTARQLVAGVFDNSFWGNQGIKALFSGVHTKAWSKGIASSWKNFVSVLRHGAEQGDVILDAAYADYYGRSNKLNGRYDGKAIDGTGKRGDKLSIGSGEEEITSDFISTLGEKTKNIPILNIAFNALGRASKATNVAYEVGAMELRMAVADTMYKLQEGPHGLDLKDGVNIGAINRIANSMTGRGHLGKLERASEVLNLYLFSARFFKSNLDFLSAHMLDREIPMKLKGDALKNLVTVGAVTMTILGIAKVIDPENTELDPRSPKFGKIRGMDITGGASPIVRVLARIILNSTKNAQTGVIKPLGSGFGQTSRMDLITDFIEGKASPLMGALRDYLKDRNFEGEEPSLFGTAAGLSTPMSAENTLEILEDKESGVFEKAISIPLSLHGASKMIMTKGEKWKVSKSADVTAFKESVDKEEFEMANDEFNREYSEWLSEVQKNEEYTALDEEQKAQLITNKKKDIKKQVFLDHGFRYKAPKKEKLPKL